MNVSDYGKKCDEAYKTMMDKNAELGEGISVGKVFRVGVADGYSYYEITRVNKKTVRVKWVSNKWLNGDGYHSPILGDGGSFQTHIIDRLVDMADSNLRWYLKAK